MTLHSRVLAASLALSCGGAMHQTTLAWDEESSGAMQSTADAADTTTTTTTTTTTDTPAESSSSESATPLPDLPPADTCPRIRVVTPPAEPLNVRPDPSTAAEPIGSLGNGSIVDVLDEVQGESIEGNTLWFHIAYLASDGYVSAVFAECTQDMPPEPPDGYNLPLPCGMQVTCTQGNLGETSHTGLHAYAFDFGVGLGTPLVAMADGTVSVTFAETMPGDPCYDGGGPECGPYGNEVVVLHGDGLSSMYKHLSAVEVATGDVVTRGQQIGLSGTSGYSTGRHVHVMLMESCGQLTCQSVPLEFVEAGVPVEGDVVVSENCP